MSAVTGVGLVPEEDVVLLLLDAAPGEMEQDWASDDVNGGWFKAEKVREARRDEIGWMHRQKPSASLVVMSNRSSKRLIARGCGTQ